MSILWRRFVSLLALILGATSVHAQTMRLDATSTSVFTDFTIVFYDTGDGLLQQEEILSFSGTRGTVSSSQGEYVYTGVAYVPDIAGVSTASGTLNIAIPCPQCWEFTPMVSGAGGDSDGWFPTRWTYATSPVDLTSLVYYFDVPELSGSFAYDEGSAVALSGDLAGFTAYMPGSLNVVYDDGATQYSWNLVDLQSPFGAEWMVLPTIDPAGNWLTGLIKQAPPVGWSNAEFVNADGARILFESSITTLTTPPTWSATAVRVFAPDGSLLVDYSNYTTTPPENNPPTADAGPDQTVYVGDEVFLDGGGSSDPEEDPLSFGWSFTSTPAGSTAVLGDSTAAQTSFTPDLPGTYVLSLAVSDPDGPGTASNVVIEVLEPIDPVRANIESAIADVSSMPGSAFLSPIYQGAMISRLQSALFYLDTYPALSGYIIGRMIQRSNGCAVNGSPDVGGGFWSFFSRDWVTDCDEQTALHDSLVAARDGILALI